jgi:hypothetical protein
MSRSTAGNGTAAADAGAAILGYDAGECRRRGRALDLGTTAAFIEAEASGVSCPEHGVVEFSKSSVAGLMRVSWRSVGWILVRKAGVMRTPVFWAA